MQKHIPLLAEMLIHSIYDKEPDYVIGTPDDPYLQRWWLRKDNEHGNIYLHKILKDDEADTLHDHPFCSTSIILSGIIREIMPTGERLLSPGSITYRHATERHRLEVVAGPVWSLFITGNKEREWGFISQNGLWLHHTRFVEDHSNGSIIKAISHP